MTLVKRIAHKELTGHYRRHERRTTCHLRLHRLNCHSFYKQTSRDKTLQTISVKWWHPRRSQRETSSSRETNILDSRKRWVLPRKDERIFCTKNAKQTSLCVNKCQVLRLRKKCNHRRHRNHQPFLHVLRLLDWHQELQKKSQAHMLTSFSSSRDFMDKNVWEAKEMRWPQLDSLVKTWNSSHGSEIHYFSTACLATNTD